MCRFTVMDELRRVLDELAFKGTMATVGKIWRGTSTKNREARARSVGDSKGRAGEVDGVVRYGKQVQRRTSIRRVCGLWRESERGGVGFVMKERKIKAINRDNSV